MHHLVLDAGTLSSNPSPTARLITRPASTYSAVATALLMLVFTDAASSAAAGDNDRSARMLTLYKEEQGARLKLSGPWSDAASALEFCAAAKKMSYRAETCDRAQKVVNACNAAREDWRKRKQAMLSEIDKAQPGIGQQYTPGISPIRGVGRQANAIEVWNDSIKGLRGMEIVACPHTLPDTFLTPAQALEQWVKEEGGAAAIIVRCDSLSRELFVALDAEDIDRAASLNQQFDSACGREQRTYAERAALARERLAALRATRAAATPPRKTGYAASLVQGAITQAEDDAQDPEAARRRKADEAQRNAAERQAIAQRSDENVARIMSGLQTMLTGALANPGAGAPSVTTVLKQSVAPEYSALVAGIPTGTGGASANYPQTAATASVSSSGGGNCAAEYARQESEFNTINQRAGGSSALIPGYQRVLYMTSERMKLLDQHCRGQSQYNEYASIRQTHDGALRSCQQSASDRSLCVAKIAY